MSQHPHPLDLLIRNLELRSPLSDADKEQILALPCQTRELEAGTYTRFKPERVSHGTLTSEQLKDAIAQMVG